MSRKTLIVVAQAVVITTAIVGLVVLGIRMMSEDDDRPPIIVRNGSMTIDDGDAADTNSNHWKGWKKHDGVSAKRWRPDQAKGKSVTDFTVTIAGSSDAAACPAGTTFTGTEVAIDYTLASNSTVSTVRVIREAILGSPGKAKQEPLISAPDDLSEIVNIGPAPPRLVYNPGAGYISKVTVTTPGGPSSCPFTKPDTDDLRRSVRIGIKPNK